MKVYVITENDVPVGVTFSKAKAENWLYTSANDYLTFDADEAEPAKEVQKPKSTGNPIKDQIERFKSRGITDEEELRSALLNLQYDPKEIQKYLPLKKTVPTDQSKRNLMKNVDRLDKGIGEANKELSTQLEGLKKRFAPKSRLLRRRGI